MREQIEILVNLQKILSEVVIIRTSLDQVPEKLEKLSRQAQAFEDEIAEKTALIDSLKKAYREYEADASQNQAQVAKSQEKLQAVKTNKEYQSSLKEIEEMNGKHSLLEDEMLECLDRIDTAEKALAERKSAFKRVSGELEAEKRDIEREAEKEKTRLARLEAQEKQVADTVDPRTLAVFVSVRKKQHNGVAIVPAVDEVCQGCNVNFPPQMYNELQRYEKIEFCPNCQRIIYWGKH